MIRKIYENPDIYQIKVELPDNPLRYINSYVLNEGERPLIIDTGFNRSECYKTLMEGLQKLNIDLTRTDLFITHLHGDHSGLAYKFARQGCTIYMNPEDHNYFKEMLRGNVWPQMEEMFYREGFSRKDIAVQKSSNQARLYAAEDLYPIIPVNHGDTLRLAGQIFTAIWTPGHTKGHTCLYLPEKEIIFLGDHVLFDITPNITRWSNMKDALGMYLKSLDELSKYRISLALPGHRENEIPLSVRIEQIKEHHKQRLAYIKEIIENEPGLTACEIASRLPWSVRGKKWDEFSPTQKWFAMGETLSHLDYLLIRGRIERIEKNETLKYVVI